MKDRFSNDDFKDLSWHDNHLYGISWKVGGKSDISDLILDIDHICEWLCDKTKRTCSFKVAPATLTFHGITDLKMHMDWGDSGFQTSHVGGTPILEIKRELVREQKVYFDRPYYQWRIQLASPHQKSFVSFGAWGFTMVLRKAPIPIQQQYLPLDERGS